MAAPKAKTAATKSGAKGKVKLRKKREEEHCCWTSSH